MQTDSSAVNAVLECARDVGRYIADGKGDPTPHSGEIIASIGKLLRHPGIFGIGMPRTASGIETSYTLYYDPNLMILMATTRKGKYDKPHNHGSWLATGVYKGECHYRGFRRLDNGQTPNFADLEVVEDRILGPGDVALSALPPHDVNEIMSITDNCMMVVTGGGLATARQYYDVEKKTYEDRLRNAA